MTRPCLIAALVFCPIILSEAHSQDDLEKQIAKLGSDDPAEREAAVEAIRKIGEEAIPHLNRALDATSDLEVRLRLERLLLELQPAVSDLDYSVRFEGREALVARGGGARSTESAVLGALKWLARHQNPDGSWSQEGFPKRCTGGACTGAGERDHDVGATGLALLAFLGAGYTQLSKDELPDPVNPGSVLKFGDVVRRGLDWLAEHQDREGCVGERGLKYIYNHAVATAALGEAYGLSRSEARRGMAQRAANFLMAAQNPGKAWRYSVKCGDNDTSVTGWAVEALKSAAFSSLNVPQRTFEGAVTWLDEATESNGYFRVGYNARSTGKVFIPGKNETFDNHFSMSAISVFSRILIQRRRNEPALAAVNLLVSDLPEWKENRIDFYYWYWGTLALFQYDGPSGPVWKRWNEAMRMALVPHQRTGKDGCKSGSWDPEVDRWGSEGGRIYATAINALTLETYYRFPVVPDKK